MGKRGGAKAKGSAIDLLKHGDDWDNMSTTSSCTTFTTCAEHFGDMDRVDMFSSALDELFEKRGSTREKALASLIGHLRDDIREEDCVKNEATLVSRCLTGIRKGSNIESVLSCQLLALHLITLPHPRESLFRELQPDLQRTAGAGSKPGDVRCAALDCLAMCCFVAAEDDVCTMEVMERCRALWRTGDAKVRACGVRAWSFLATSLNSGLPAPTVESVMCDVGALLHDGDVEVRNTAGELAALLCDVCGVGAMLAEVEARSRSVSRDGSVAGDGDGEEDGEGNGVNGAGVVGLESVVGRMRDLATGHKTDSLRRNKREKASLRSTFRSVLAVVESGQASVTKIKLQHGDSLVVDTVRGTVMLSAFRRALCGGFQLHLQANPLLHDVFSFTPANTRPEKLSALEKRALRSPNSASARAKTHERKGDRAAKASRHGHGHGHDH